MNIDNEELMGLIARCALRDQAAFAKLYEKTSRYLNTVAYRIVRSNEESSEVLQDAFVQIWNNASSFTPHQGKALTWMASIVRYRAIDRIKAESRHQNRPDAEEEQQILESTPGQATPEGEHYRGQLNQQVALCLKQMNEKFMKCVELAYLYGYSREELAEMLDANVNTVKSWLRRGSAKLKECMENAA